MKAKTSAWLKNYVLERGGVMTITRRLNIHG